jgi:hypothetical protein
MRSHLILLTLCAYFAFAALACTSKPAPDAATDTNSTTDTQAADGKEAKEHKEHKEHREHKETAETRDTPPPKPAPLVVPSGTAVNVSLGSALGSKLSKIGQTFTGSVAEDVVIGGEVAIPKGATVNGTVTDAKPLGRFAGGASLDVRLDSINVNGADLPVQAKATPFSAKGKGKRTAILAGGGAALGGIVGALAGGGKGAAIGMAAGAGAGGAGAAFTGDKEIVLPAESAVAFELSQPLQVR